MLESWPLSSIVSLSMIRAKDLSSVVYAEALQHSIRIPRELMQPEQNYDSGEHVNTIRYLYKPTETDRHFPAVICPDIKNEFLSSIIYNRKRRNAPRWMVGNHLRVLFLGLHDPNYCFPLFSLNCLPVPLPLLIQAASLVRKVHFPFAESRRTNATQPIRPRRLMWLGIRNGTEPSEIWVMEWREFYCQMPNCELFVWVFFFRFVPVR